MIRILIADDHAILREGLKQILAECPDIKVEGEAGNGFDVLKMVCTRDWDILVLDMSMPGKSGIELIKQVRVEKPKLPILILSMHKEDMYAVRTIKAGASGYLTKDSASSLLVSAIRKVASGGIYVSDEVTKRLFQGLNETGDAPSHTQLSDREYQVFLLLVNDRSISEIADELHLSVKTVSTHKTRIMEKMRLDNLSALIKYAIRHGLTDASGDISE